jgi:acyl-CoA thioester hydrolase
MTPLPTYEQVLEVPATTTRTVPAEFLDDNQHMNIARYFELTAGAVVDLCDELGIGEAAIVERGITVFTVEQHLRYFAEVRLGHEVSVHVRLIARSAKGVHAMAFLVNRTTRQLACTFEDVFVNISWESRKPTDFPDDLAATLDAFIADDPATWPAPVCESMGVR